MTHRCTNRHRCAAHIDGDARETERQGMHCEACLDRTAGQVADLPGQHLRLHGSLGERGTGIDAGIRHQRPGSTVLLNVHIDALMGDIVDTVNLAAELLADRLGQPDPGDLVAAATLLAPNLNGLENYGPVDTMAWSTTGWTRSIATTTGHLLVARLDRLARVARQTLGQTRARIRRDLPCTRCGQHGVGRWAGADWFDCSHCGARFAEDDLRRQDRILLALHTRKAVHA